MHVVWVLLVLPQNVAGKMRVCAHKSLALWDLGVLNAEENNSNVALFRVVPLDHSLLHKVPRINSKGGLNQELDNVRLLIDLLDHPESLQNFIPLHPQTFLLNLVGDILNTRIRNGGISPDDNAWVAGLHALLNLN